MGAQRLRDKFSKRRCFYALPNPRTLHKYIYFVLNKVFAYRIQNNDQHF